MKGLKSWRQRRVKKEKEKGIRESEGRRVVGRGDWVERGGLLKREVRESDQGKRERARESGGVKREEERRGEGTDTGARLLQPWRQC